MSRSGKATLQRAQLGKARQVSAHYYFSSFSSFFFCFIFILFLPFASIYIISALQPMLARSSPREAPGHYGMAWPQASQRRAQARSRAPNPRGPRFRH
jgi:hypothetical protein